MFSLLGDILPQLAHCVGRIDANARAWEAMASGAASAGHGAAPAPPPPPAPPRRSSTSSASGRRLSRPSPRASADQATATPAGVAA